MARTLIERIEESDLHDGVAQLQLAESILAE
jgi:hypothetical protein